MADVTGALHHSFGDKTHTLRLTLGGIANLQGRYGNDLGGLLSGKIEGTPPFRLLIDVVAEALKKGEGLSEDDAAALADDMLTADKQLVQRVLDMAFPTQDASGNAKAPGAKHR